MDSTLDTARPGVMPWLAKLVHETSAHAGGMLLRAGSQVTALSSIGHSEQSHRDYAEHFAAQDPLGRIVAAGAGARWIACDAWQHPQYVCRTELLEDYLKVHRIRHIAAVSWQQGDGQTVFIGMQRFDGAPPFSRVELSRLDQVLPHLKQGLAAHTAARTHCAHDTWQNCVADALPDAVIVVDELLHIHDMNQAAAFLLARRAGLRYSGGFLASDSPVTAIRLRGAVARARRTQTAVVFELAHHTRPVFVSVTPLAAANERRAVVTLTRQHSDDPWLESTLRAIFGLTPAESRLAAALADGLALTHYAAAMGITLATARTQLKTVLSKTATHRQAELVALVLRLPRLMRGRYAAASPSRRVKPPAPAVTQAPCDPATAARSPATESPNTPSLPSRVVH